MYENEFKKSFSKREIKIMHKAKAYGVEALSSKYSAKELFELTFKQDLNTKDIEKLLELYRSYDESIEIAQLSSSD
jgi:hypothetical protein